MKFDRQHRVGFYLANMSTPSLHYPEVYPVGSNENASSNWKREKEWWKRFKRKLIEKIHTVRRSGRYPRLATEAATPSARRGPERARILVVARAPATAWGEALAFRVVMTIWPEGLAETSTV